jgi:hypothetical protein
MTRPARCRPATMPDRSSGEGVAEPFYVVEVEDQRHEGLAGHTGTGYVSPAQPRAQALALIGVLLGRSGNELGLEDGPWRLAIAGGSRVIRVHAARPDGQLTI